jgi:hypothetical protein
MKRKYGKVGEFLLVELHTALGKQPLFKNQAELVKLLSGLPPEVFSASDIKSAVSKIVLGKQAVPSTKFVEGMLAAIQEKLKDRQNLAKDLSHSLFTLCHNMRHGNESKHYGSRHHSYGHHERGSKALGLSAAAREVAVPKARAVLHDLGLKDTVINILISPETGKAVLPYVEKVVELESPDEASRKLRKSALLLAIDVLTPKS